MQNGLGGMNAHIMFILAMMGCDTTSAPYNKGHITGYSKLEEDDHLQSLVTKFSDSSASQDDVAAAGERFFVKLYGGKSEDGLDKTRFKTYARIVGKKPPNYVLDLASLPPTSAAAREHSLRVYHQMQAWRGNRLPPTEWGWKLEHGQHIPTTTLLPPAPNHLLYTS